MSIILRSFGRLAHVAMPIVLSISLSDSAFALERRPVAAVTIYPGDIIREQMLSDADFPDAILSSSFVSSRAMIVGKIAKRTLLPGKPIATNAVGEAKVVSVGAMVRLVFVEGGLEIVTYATALQAGAVGDFVSVRNKESGTTVGGIVQSDGSIHVGPG